jgi:hypothetical protein
MRRKWPQEIENRSAAQVPPDALRGILAEPGIRVPRVWNAAPDLPSHMRLVWAIRNGDLLLVQDQVREILTNRPQYIVTRCLYASNSDRGDAPRRFAWAAIRTEAFAAPYCW